MAQNKSGVRLQLAGYGDPDLPLREAVYQTLRKAILTGELSPEERLTEIQLGQMLGTSRTPIREAIRALELEGLVVIVPRSGAKVAPIREQDLKDVLEVRRSLDVLCAQLACQRITPEQRELLSAAMEQFERAVADGDKTAIAKADVELHDVIAQSAGNRRLLTILSPLADQVYRYRFEYIKDDHYYDRLIEEHRAICGAILRGDELQAAEAAKTHIDHQEESIRKTLQ